MKNLLIALFLASPLGLTQRANAETDFNNKQYTLAATYQYNAQNPDGTNPTSTINLTLSPSVIFDDTHEFGGSLSYSVSKSEVTFTNTSTTTSTSLISAFYRYNLTISKTDAKIPVVLYVGPQIGQSSIKAGGTSSSDMSAGGQVGFNLMFSKSLALNIHAFQFDTVFATDTQLLLTQSIGIKYYF